MGQRPHVIILAQGQQTRLPELPQPKQLMRLPLAGGVPIVARTLIMTRVLAPTAHVTLVARRELADALAWTSRDGDEALRTGAIFDAAHLELEVHELADPGNSSLKGISRYLDHRRDLASLSAMDFTPASTIVLLGDVVYSWRCLNILLSDALSHVFVGTSDLSEGTGELWGIAWRSDADDGMTDWLKRAVRRHPPFAAYQCGQLRQWFFTARRDMESTMRSLERARAMVPFITVDDYTKDFDIPSDLDHLLSVSGHAAQDDASHGIVWGERPS